MLFSKTTVYTFAVLAATSISLPEGSAGHGGLVQPASRGWAWYAGFTDVPVNYNWSECVFRAVG